MQLDCLSVRALVPETSLLMLRNFYVLFRSAKVYIILKWICTEKIVCAQGQTKEFLVHRVKEKRISVRTRMVAEII